MKLELPASVSSRQDLNELLLEVRQYAGQLSHDSIKKQAGAEASQPPDLSESARGIVNQWHGDKTPTSKTLDKLIAALEKHKETAPIIAITLAAPPGPKLKARIADWCRCNLKNDVLIDFSFDSSLLGGMVVRWGSHIYDWSFRRQILDNRRYFAEVIRRV